MTSFYGSVNGGQGGGGEGIDTSTLMQKNNPTFNGTITGPNARFTGTVQIPEPTEDNHAATKGYVDAALADVDLSEVTTRMDAIETAQDELAAQLDDKVDAENPVFTGTATLNGKNIATVDQIPNISDLPYLDENNPTYTGTLTGAGATFSGTVSVPTPTQDGQAVNKQYVDQAIAGVQPEVDLSEVQADIAELQTGKLNKANPTYTGSLTGENAAFSGTVTVATPAAEGEAANKGYVDTAKTELEGDINTLQQTVENQAETINTLNQQVINITGGTAELPYLKNTGDSGTGVYDFTGATVNAADPVDNGNVATKHYVDQKVASAGGAGGVVSYTQGDGISISPENEISLSIDSAGANGLKVGANGLGLDLATGTTSGAMAASDKIAIASNTTEITNIKDGTTELPYLKETNPTYEGTLIGGDATFTGSVQISTPDQDNEAANKGYVDTALAEAKSYTDNAVSGIASDETIQQIQSDIENIENGTTVLPYLSSAGGTVTGPIKYGTSPKDTSDLANKAYVDAIHVQAVADAKNYTDSEITNLENGTTELPYIKNNGDTVTGSYDLTGAAVTIAEPVSNNSPATKKYVDDSISAIDVSEQIAPLTGRVAAAEGEIDTLQTDVEAVETSVTNITNGTTELPYVKDSGDTVTGTYNFNGTVTVNQPTENGHVANKQYVDSAIDTAETALTEDINEVQQSVMQQTGTIDILSQTLSAITQGTMALPYVKKAGDTMSGELIVDTAGSAESPNVVTKISGGQAAFGDSAAADYALTIGFNGENDYPSIDFNDDEGDGGAIHIKPETVTSLGVTTDTGYANVRLADPVENDDAATKRYVDEGGNNPAGLMSVPGAILRSDGEITLAPIEIVDSAPGININSFTLYGISTTNNPENLISPDIFEDGYYNSSGTKLTDTNGLSFSFDVQDGINTYYVSYSGTLKQDIASYSYAITEVLSTGDVYGTRGDSGAVPDTITIANTGGQPAKTSKIIVSIYGTNFSTVQNEVAIAITLGNLQIGTDYMLSPDHPKDITGIKTSENNQIAYLNVSQSDNSIDNPLTEYLSYLNITNELHGFFSAVYINRGADFDLNGFDCFYDDTAPLNIFDTYIVFCADKYTYKTNKYTKNIGSITINGDNASSLLSVAQLPTFTRGGAGGSTLTPATSLNVIKINVEDCVAGKIFTSMNAPLLNHVDRASIASGMSIRNKQYIVSTHFSPIRIDDIKNVSIYQTPLNDNTIFYGWSFTETPVDIDSFESNFQFDGSICFYSSKITTVEQAISYFTSNPLTVKYVLKEPEIYNIPTEDYFSYKSIDRILDGSNYIGVINVPMVSGEPNLSSDPTSVPFSIKYYNDYQKRIDYIYSAIYNLPTQSDVDEAKEKREQITSWSDDGYTFSNSSGMDYNTLYIFDKTTAIPTLTIESFRTPSDTTYVYTYHFIFRSGATPTVLTLPPDVILPDGFEIEANRIYEINIMENLLSYQSWPVE